METGLNESKVTGVQPVQKEPQVPPQLQPTAESQLKPEVTDQKAELNAPQIHLQLQPQLAYEERPQPELDVSAKPQLHPILGSQVQVQGINVPQSAPQAPAPVQVRPVSQEPATSTVPPHTYQYAYLNQASVPLSVPSELEEVDLGTALAPPTAPEEVHIKQAPIAMPVPAPVPGIHNPPEQVANILTDTTAVSGQPPSSDAVSELQERAALAEKRVQLMDTTIDILVETFKNKYLLDKELEKRCSKLLKATALETTDQSLKEDLETLSKSISWTKEQIKVLEDCLHEKHVNMQIAGPLVDLKRERKKEAKQMKSIEKAARKIQEKAMNRDKAQMTRGKKQSEGRMVDEAWQQLPPPSQ